MLFRSGVSAEDRALQYIAKTADGSLRDALSLLDQCIAFYPGQKLSYDNVLEVLGAVDTSVYSSMFNNIINSDTISCIRLAGDMIMAGRDLNQFITEFTWYLRNLLVILGGGADIVDVSTEQLLNMQQDAARTNMEVLTRYIRILSELSGQIKYATQKRVLVEICLIKLCKPQMDAEQDFQSVITRLAVLEKQLGSIMANGVAAPVNTAMPAASPAYGESQPEGNKEKTPQKAVPEDIKDIIKNWNKIIQQCGRVEQDMLVNVKKIVSESGALILQFTDPVDEAYFRKEDGRPLEALETIILNITDKEAVIETRTVTEEINSQFTDLSQIIHFDGIEYI